MELIIIDIIRYFIGGLFGFFIFNNSKKFIIRKVVMPSAVYALILTFFKIFIIDHPIITSVSILTMFMILWLKNKFENWHFSLTYSLFVGCLMECAHILIFKIVSISRNTLGISQVTYATRNNLVFSRLIILLLYAIALLLIYIFKSVDIKTITKISKYKAVHIFLIFSLIMVIYSKYHIKYTLSDEFHNTLSWIFLIFTVMFFVLSLCAKSFAEIIAKLQEKKLNPAVEEAKLRKGQRYAGMNFLSTQFNFELDYFKDELEKIGMDKQDHGSIQVAFAAVLLKHEDNFEKVSFRSKIYFYVGEILEIQLSTVESNIGNSLKRHWALRDSTVLLKIEENYDGPVSKKNAAPTPKEFLTHLVKKSENTEIKIFAVNEFQKVPELLRHRF